MLLGTNLFLYKLVQVRMPAGKLYILLVFMHETALYYWTIRSYFCTCSLISYADIWDVELLLLFTLNELFAIWPFCMQQKIVTNSNWAFEVRLSRVYTRAVFNRFEEAMKSATAFRITQDPERGEHAWLVCHTSTSKKIVWGQHQFQVTVDQESGLLTCECKRLEHTGMKLCFNPFWRTSECGNIIRCVVDW